MLVETTQSHDSFEDAQDTLEGLKTLPGFRSWIHCSWQAKIAARIPLQLHRW